MNETLTFGGVRSSSYKVYLSGESTLNAPIRSVEMITIPGRNGQLSLDGGRYENIEVTYPAFCWAENREDWIQRIRDVRNAFASQIGYQRLVDDFNPDEFRLGVFKSGIDVAPVRYITGGEFNLTFDCKPQRFLLSGEQVQTFTRSTSITNPTAYASSPLLKVTGKGQVGIGTYSFTLAGETGQVIYIDCETMEAWEMSGSAKVSRNDYVQYAGNQFPKLAAGVNGISLGSGITKIEITPRWWRL